MSDHLPSGSYLRGLKPDGLHTPLIKRHSVEKIRLHNSYVDLFSTASRNRWPQRAYLGLYSGPGRAEIEGDGEIIETSAMSAMRIRVPFTKYIFVDSDPRCIESLRARIQTLEDKPDATLIQKNVSDAVPEIFQAMPHFSRDNGLLSFCFVDPFSAALQFEVIEALGKRYRMDFMILLMIGRDVRTNFARYLADPTDERIGALIADPNWRDEWQQRRLQPNQLVRFILEKFDSAMTGLGYQAMAPAESQSVKVAGKGVFLYSLVFYTRSDLGKRLWKATRAATDQQMGLGF